MSRLWWLGSSLKAGGFWGWGAPKNHPQATLEAATRQMEETMTRKPNTSSWRLDRRINLSVLVQLTALGSLILGSWLNLQRQLDLLQRDVTMLLKSQETVTQKLEALSARSLSQEYRVQAIEKRLGEKP